MKSKIALGVDIGGSFIKVAIVNRSGEALETDIFPTPQSPPDVAISIIADDIDQFIVDCEIDSSDIHGIGVGFPGAVRTDNGLVEASPNLKLWRGIELSKFFEEAFSRPVRVDNDANAAALGEFMWGKCRGADPLVLFTLGTGVGGGIVIGGKIFRGKWGGGAELGHHSIDMNGRVCTCGNRGCIEAYAGAKGVTARTWELLKEDRGSLLWEMMNGDYGSLDGEMVGLAAKESDATALKVAEEVARALGVATANVINIFNPECVIFSGGMTEWGEEILLKKIRFEAKSRSLKAHFSSCQIEFSESGQLSGVLGAAALAFSK